MISIRSADQIPLDDVIARSPVKTNPRAKMVLSQCLARSEHSWTGLVDGQIVCLWGLCPPTLLSDQAYIWLLTTDEIEEHKFLFIRHSQMMMEKMLDVYPVIIGEVEINNFRARQWLRWLGAKFITRKNGTISFEIRKRIR